MAIDEKLITWKGMNVDLIQNAYDITKPMFIWQKCDDETMKKIKFMMETFLPDYKIKCDYENNPPNVINSGHIMVRVSSSNTSDYIDVIF